MGYGKRCNAIFYHLDNTIIIVYRCATIGVCFTLLPIYSHTNIFLLVHCRLIMPINHTKEGKIIWNFWSTLKNTFKKKKKRKNSFTNLHNGKGNSYSSAINSFKEIRTPVLNLHSLQLGKETEVPLNLYGSMVGNSQLVKIVN